MTNNGPTGRRKEHLIATGIIAAAVAAGILAVVLSDPFGNKGGGAEALDSEVWETLREVPQDLIVYKQTRSIAAEINAPSAIAVGNDDHLYAGGQNAIRVLDADGIMLREWPMARPVKAIAVDASELVYVATDRLEIYADDGEKVLESPPLPGKVTLTSIAVGHDVVYLADAGNATICRMNMKGEIIGWIERDPTTGQGEPFVIRSPHLDVALDEDENLWVAHAGRFRIEKRTPEGRLISSWGKGMQYGEKDIAAFAGCCNPTDIALGSNGTLVTAEKAIERIKLYDRGGMLLGVIAPPDAFIAGTPSFDVACDSHGRVHVLDPLQAVILTYEEKAE